jgi:hypothetical protein
VKKPIQPARQLPNPDIQGKWVNGRTAILVIHGIGHQNPLETVDQFGRTLIDTFERSGKIGITASHRLAKKKKADGRNYWFDNFLRLEPTRKREVTQPVLKDQEAPAYLDVFEYYWANRTEDKASLKDIIDWTSAVSKGARKFYKDREAEGKLYNDKSIFFSKGKFNHRVYRVVLHLVGVILPASIFLLENILKFLQYFPVVGTLVSGLVRNLADSALGRFANVIGDIVVYNSTDRKSKFYATRSEILTGAVKALRYLLETDENDVRRYDRVILAGHSLGSQVAYDAVNRLVHLVNFGEVHGWDCTGKAKDGTLLADTFSGFITFGSPLDKIAFFLRENVPQPQYLRQQMLANFHAFKYQRLGTRYSKQLASAFVPLLDTITWVNFHDGRDWVSGSLEYYRDVLNLDCWFAKPWFTHSAYWDSEAMFKIVIHACLVNENPTVRPGLLDETQQMDRDRSETQQGQDATQNKAE